MAGPENTDYGMQKSVTVLGRTFPVSDPWKSTASERPSNAIESLGGRARVQIAATIEYNITVRAEQRRMPVLALEIWRYTDSILWCSKPSWNITLYVRDHIIRTRRHLDR